MSKYKVGDLVFAPVGYMDTKSGYYKSQERRFVVVSVGEDDGEDTENITLSLTGQVHQAEKHKGIIVKANSKEGIAMECTKDTFIYCDYTVTYKDREITRRFANCPIIEDILKLLNN